MHDDLVLADLVQVKRLDGTRPLYPLVGTALNLVAAKQLDWQDRKAASFCLTPGWCGYLPPDSRRGDAPIGDLAAATAGTADASQAAPRTESLAASLTLGSAIAISGAAVNPNMGYHSSPAVTFLLTLFDARLGWWLPNPSHPQRPRADSTPFFGRWLLAEMLGQTRYNPQWWRYFGGLADRPEVRVVILRGAGRGFCAGLDIQEDRTSDETPVLRTLRTQTRIGNIYRKMRACPQPIVALGHGAACGGGLSLLLASDVRYAAPSFRANAAYIRIGLGGCDMASSYFLPRLVGASLASEMILTGRFIDAERALRAGLVSEIVEEAALLDRGLALADEMLATSPYGLRLSKQALNLNIDAQSLDAAMAIEDRQQVILSATEDHREALAAFLEKRAPDYRER